MDTDAAKVVADTAADASDQVRVEGGGKGKRCRVDRRLERRETRQALFMGDGGDAEASPVHEVALHGGQPRDTLARRHRRDTEGPGDLTEPVEDRLVPRGLLEDVVKRVHRLLVRRRIGLEAEPGKGTPQLRDLLFERHLCKEVTEAFVPRT